MTIKQKTLAVDIEGGQKITVRRMRWKAARNFLKRLAAVVAGIYKETPLPEIGSTDAAGVQATLVSESTRLMDRLPEIIESSEELMEMLALESTDLTAEQFDNMDALAASAVLAAAVTVNMDAELKNCWTGIGATVAALMPVQKTT